MSFRPCVVAGWALVILAVVAQAVGGAGDVGLEAIARFARYPFLMPETQPHYLSSFDRSGGNDDGFEGTYSALYTDEHGEHVIFDVKGPGAVYTMWFTSRENGWAPLGWGRLRFYFDDQTTPRLDVDANELFGGRRPPFVPPFVFGPFTSTGGHVTYLPLPFARRLKITTEKRAGFYNIYYHTYAPDAAVESWTGKEETAEVARLWRQAGHPPQVSEGALAFEGTVRVGRPGLPDGELVPTVAEIWSFEGSGAITSVRVRPLFPLTAYQLQHVILRIYWDGEETPSVEAPLGIFFGSGLGEASVRAVPLGMSPSGAYYCYLPMPFWKQARVELMNENAEPVPPIHWTVEVTPESAYPYPATATGYFRARYSHAWPTAEGRDYVLLETGGRGVYVGQVMTVEPLRPEIKRWWEGDLRIYLDGRRQPAFHGTGHEDDYLGGWSNEWLMSPYSLPMHGEPKTAGLRPIDFQWNAATTVYRFFPAGVPFQNGIRVATEHGVDNAVPVMYSSVAFFYSRPEPMERLDVLEVGAADDEERHRYVAEGSERVELGSQFEGEADRVNVTDTGRAVNGSSRFRLASDGGDRALRLRRLYDQATPQEAEVRVNGRPAGVWYAPAVNPVHRWAESDFLLPRELTRRVKELSIEIRVRRAPWSEYRYELWALP